MVERHQRVGPARQPFARLDLRGERVDHVTGEHQRLADHLAELLDGDLLARRVDRREVGGRGDTVHVVGANRELAALQIAAQADSGARLEPVLQPGLVEPDGRDLTGVVGDASLYELQAARALDTDAQNLAGDRRLVLAEQVRDRQLRRRGLVAARPVLERVPDRPEPQRCQTLLDRRPDSVERLEPELEPLGPGRAREARPRRGLVNAREAAHRPQAPSGECSASSGGRKTI